MAEETGNFPRLPAKHWWAVRDRLKRSVPATITPAYLESALNVELPIARDILTQLEYLGLTDNEGKPTETAEDWRHDDTYAKACKEILEKVYPEELRHAAGSDRDAAQRWFARRKKVGENAALKMAITYQLVVEGDHQKAPDPSKAAAIKPKSERVRQSPEKAAERKEAVAQTDPPPAAQGNSAVKTTPSLHIDVQIHIAADATPAQIDQIFASMAKHLYKAGNAAE